MKTKALQRFPLLLLLFSGFLMSCQNEGNAQPVDFENPSLNPLTYEPVPVLPTEDRHPTKKIKIALLLDTSNSMDGLIEQAKSQLWLLVNELAEAKCDGMRPSLEIALYEYGNSGLSANNGFIRLVTALTDDLDQVSEDLFKLTTNGGSEHCGQVIYTSLNELQWSESSGDLQVIFIAGNEPFTQGPISYKLACNQAKTNHVTVNTIFCGPFNTGINTFWKDGASLTGGDYMSINHNSKTVFIPSPYDKEIAKLNDDLNKTYIYYGSKGKVSKEKQMAQDVNAESYGLENKVSRTRTKSKHVYKNSSWDLVDAVSENKVEIEKLEEEGLDPKMKQMNTQERKAYIDEQAKERTRIKAKIKELGDKRDAFVANERKTKSEVSMLDNAMLSAIQRQAKAKNFNF